MARWFMATNNATGERAGPLAAADDQDAPGGYSLEEWAISEIDREPGEFEKVEDGIVVLDAAAMDAALHAKIDVAAGRFRLRFITDVPGQSGTYIEKEKQAWRCLADEDEAEWPMIAGEAAARGITPAEMAAFIAGIAAEWRAVDALIETRRITAKLEVSAATTAEEKRAAAAVDWEALLRLSGPDLSEG
jgi:hypothetical protein